MVKIAFTLLLSLFSLGAIAQSDITFSLAGIPLKKEDNTITIAALMKDPKLTVSKSGYTVTYSTSYLPAQGDLTGPFEMTSGVKLNPLLLRSIEASDRGKLFFDEVKHTAPNGTSTTHNSFVIKVTK